MEIWNIYLRDINLKLGREVKFGNIGLCVNIYMNFNKYVRRRINYFGKRFMIDKKRILRKKKWVILLFVDYFEEGKSVRKIWEDYEEK